MIKEAVKIFKEYKQIKDADNYVKGLTPLYEEIFKALPEAKKTIDLGGAYGIMALACKLRGDDVTLMDMTAKFTNLEMLKKQGIGFVKHDLEKDKDIGQKADLVIFTEVLEHLNSNPLPTIQKIYRALNPGGYLICSTPAKELWDKTTSMNNKGVAGLWNDLNSWRDIPEYKGKWKDQHTYHYDQFELVSLTAEAGFEVEDVYEIAGFSNLVIARK